MPDAWGYPLPPEPHRITVGRFSLAVDPARSVLGLFHGEGIDHLVDRAFGTPLCACGCGRGFIWDVALVRKEWVGDRPVVVEVGVTVVPDDGARHPERGKIWMVRG